MKKKILIMIGILGLIAILLIAKFCINKIQMNNEPKVEKVSDNLNENVISSLQYEDKISEITKDVVIQGIVELHHNGFIYIFNGQHFGELGYEIEGYTSSNIDDKNQTCVDYLTSQKYDTSYIEEGDLLICTGDLIKRKSTMNNFDTKDNPIIVLKSKDYYNMKQKMIKNKNASNITVGEMYVESGYIYLEYNMKDTTHSGKTYDLPFIQKVYITDDTKVIGELEKGDKVKVEYNNLNADLNQLKLKVIEKI